jgi:hypothetical protein
VDPAYRRVPKAALVAIRADGCSNIAAILREIVQNPAQISALSQIVVDASAGWSAPCSAYGDCWGRVLALQRQKEFKPRLMDSRSLLSGTQRISGRNRPVRSRPRLRAPYPAWP